jgi:hypothetical protein
LRHENAVLRHGRGRTRVRGRWVAHPREIPQLLALVPLPEAPSPPPEVAARGRRIVVTLPGRRLRLALERETLRPRRVALLAAKEAGETERVRAASGLAEYRRLPVPGRPPGARPWVPTRVRIVGAGEGARITLSLDGLTAEADRIRPDVFDLKALREHFRPARVERWGGPTASRPATRSGPAPSGP